MTCPGCGLQFSHVPGCRGVVVTFYRYAALHKQDGFQTIADAARFLLRGEDEGDLSSELIELPDGSTVWEQSDWRLGMRELEQLSDPVGVPVGVQPDDPDAQ